MTETGSWQGTPIAVDGIRYATTPWSYLYAFDAKTGELQWDTPSSCSNDCLPAHRPSLANLGLWPAGARSGSRTRTIGSSFWS